ncbi:uncharacterized protein [Rutidosis leptorrhynchoides]|uniref:uncharacterized protein n=1 Tax=Rutidosis leptorrhynchoides TaxID=125765 RepID=UPI003A9A079A
MPLERISPSVRYGGSDVGCSTSSSMIKRNRITSTSSTLIRNRLTRSSIRRPNQNVVTPFSERPAAHNDDNARLVDASNNVVFNKSDTVVYNTVSKQILSVWHLFNPSLFQSRNRGIPPLPTTVQSKVRRTPTTKPGRGNPNTSRPNATEPQNIQGS